LGESMRRIWLAMIDALFHYSSATTLDENVGMG
jgi:hypothetical protein